MAAGTATAATGGGSDTLTLGAIVPATTQSAADARWANESPYMQAVYDTLVHLSPTGEPEPWLATEWSYNDDNTVLTLTLRDDVKFTDGSPFNADVAAQNIQRFKDGTSPNASYFANVEDAKALDATTVVITLTQPDPALLNYLTQNGGLVESPKPFDAADEKTNPVGSGPVRPRHRRDRRRDELRVHEERGLLEPRRPALRQPRDQRPGDPTAQSTPSRRARRTAST